MKKIIAFCGYPTAGKDEAAKALVEDLGFKRVSFADPIRKAALALDPMVSQDTGWVSGRPFNYGIRLSEIVGEVGWTAAKLEPEVRRLLQVLGTEAGRDIHGSNCWVDAAVRDIESSESNRIVITDARFGNEVAMIRRMGGIIIHVCRASAVQLNDHPSEMMDYPSVAEGTLENNGTIEDLHRAAKEFASAYLA